MVKVVFLGTPKFAVPALEALAKNADVSLVITQPDKPMGRGYDVVPVPVKVAASKIGVPIVQPDNINNPDILKMIRDIGPDFIVVVAYGQILKKDWLNVSNNEILNLHASLLPEYRGASPIQSAILAGDNETGISIMGIRAKMDSGPVYLQRKVLIDDKNCDELAFELANVGAEALCEVVSHFSAYQPMEQIEKSATYCKKITRRDGHVHFDKMSAIDIDRMYRAFCGWPLIYGYFGKKRIVFTEIKVADIKLTSVPGEIVNKSGKVYVQTKDGCVELIRVKPEAKKEMTSIEFLRGLQGGTPKLS